MAKQTMSLRIDVTKIKKEWMFKGEKGVYLDVVAFMNDDEDQYGNNGMIVQSVPKQIRDSEKDLPKEKQTRGYILGNCKILGSALKESSPGTELPVFAGSENDGIPF